jgi:hypothetical protein
MFLNIMLLKLDRADSAFLAEMDRLAARVAMAGTGILELRLVPNQSEHARGFAWALYGCYADSAAYERCRALYEHEDLLAALMLRVLDMVVLDSGWTPPGAQPVASAPRGMGLKSSS